MSEDICKRWPKQRSLGEERTGEIFGALRHGIGISWLLFEYSHLRIILIVLIERQLSAEKSVQYDPETPGVYLFSTIFLASKHFRGTVTHSPTPCLKIACFPFIFPCESKIAELHVLVFIQQDIFQLEVSVYALF